MGLIDIWRETNSSSMDYTYYSNVHNTYSRIDYIFIPKSFINSATCTIGPIALSDHAFVHLRFDLCKNIPRSKSWKFNTSMLSNEAFHTLVTTWIDNYTQDNKDSPVSPATMWDAAKATLRGHLIAYASSKKKAMEAHRLDLERELECCEKIHKQSLDSTSWSHLKASKAKLNLDYTREIKKKVFFTKQKYHEYSNRPSRLLAYQLKKEQSERTIMAIRTAEDEVTYDPKKIHLTFHDFYCKLYTSERKHTEAELHSFLEGISLPKLSETDQEDLNSPFTPEEILEAITSMPPNKSPGPDGFPREFYKAFWPQLSPIFMPMLEDFCKNGVLSDSMHTARITVLLKKDKDPLSCSSFRPISLLDFDYKIITKLLAKRLNTLLPKIIKADQTGFIRDRYSSDNIRRLFDIIDQVNAQKTPVLLASLDAEKAFDRMEWNFLFSVLEKFNMGPNFIKWIKSLYSHPNAMVTTNGLNSDRCPLERGTRQGCSLSPLLYLLGAEPLAELIRSNPSIMGVSAGGLQHKISLYADDVLFYISNPEKSLPLILDTIAQYGKFSGYTINFNKSTACPLNITLTSSMKTLCPFQWKTQGFQYLGIFITPDLNSLFKENYLPLLDRIKNDLQTWISLPISLVGRINVIRMNVLPRLNYLFQMLPCYLPVGSFFKTTNQSITKFIWGNKKPRIKFSTLSKPESKGGLALPSLQLYYWSAQIRNMQTWITNRQESTWIQIEAQSCGSLPLSSIIFINNFSEVGNIAKTFVIYSTLLAWRECKKYLGISSQICSHSPIVGNPDLPKALREANFNLWHTLGIRTFSDLFHQKTTTLKSFQELCSEFDVPRSHFFKYRQIRHVISSFTSERRFRTQLNEVETLLVTAQSIKGKISYIYRLLSEKGSSSFTPLKIIWEKDLGLTISDELWAEVCDRVYCSSTSVKMK
uniref:Reverse transcriptase domain-containing protein n=1 Tax=Oncorhynchus mykiss TaxID=8022 RepID=A0A8K9UVS9_ONCMY